MVSKHTHSSRQWTGRLCAPLLPHLSPMAPPTTSLILKSSSVGLPRALPPLNSPTTPIPSQRQQPQTFTNTTPKRTMKRPLSTSPSLAFGIRTPHAVSLPNNNNNNKSTPTPPKVIATPIVVCNALRRLSSNPLLILSNPFFDLLSLSSTHFLPLSHTIHYYLLSFILISFLYSVSVHTLKPTKTKLRFFFFCRLRFSEKVLC